MFKSIKRSLLTTARGQKGLHWVRRLKGTTSKRYMALQGARLLLISSVIFVVGLGIGLGVGVWVDIRDEDHTPVNTVQLKNQDYGLENSDYILPVRVLKSERSLKDFAYEEALPAETVDMEVVEPNSVYPTTPAEAPTIKQENQTIIPPNIPLEAEQPIKQASIPPKPLNIIPPNAIPLWQRRAVDVNVPTGSPMIAIVIDDVGINQSHSKSAIALPGPLTLSFIPYGYNLQDLVNLARGNGHEVMLHLPMEPLNPSVDAGPNALLSSLDPAELLMRIEWGLSQFGDYVGINNHMGSRFTAWEPGMRLVMKEIKKRDLLFLDSVTSRDTVGFKVAHNMNVPYAIRDVFLDHDIDKVKIANQLAFVEKTAHDKGFAIAIGHPHDETVAVLSKWLLDVQKRGYTLVPVSAIVKRGLEKRTAVSG